jgi:hypothetical protein
MYVPILSARAGRLAGLAACSEVVKGRITPLFDVPRAAGPRPDDAGAAAAALEQHLAATVGAVAAAFGPRRAYLDGADLDGVRVADGRAAAAWLHDEARTRGLPLVPVTGVRRSDPYQLAVAEAAGVDAGGACVRLQMPDLADLDALPERVHALADALGLAPESLDLFVDLGRTTAAESRMLVVAARGVLSTLRRAARWRSLSLAAAVEPPRGAPRPDDSFLSGPLAPAHDAWMLWRTVAADDPASLGFGDYVGPERQDGTAAFAAAAHLYGAVPPAVDPAARAGGAADPAARAPDDAPRAAPPGGPEPPTRPPRADAPPGDAPPASDPDRVDFWADAVARHLTVTVEGMARAERPAR